MIRNVKIRFSLFNKLVVHQTCNYNFEMINQEFTLKTDIVGPAWEYSLVFMTYIYWFYDFYFYPSSVRAFLV